MAHSPMISLEGVTKVFPGTTSPAVDGLTLSVDEGEVVVLVGPSGCGKTTTLKMINRLIEPTSGRITVGGKEVASADLYQLRRSIGYVIQQVGLFPHWTIADNIATVPRLLGWERERIARRVEELIGLMGLEPEMGPRYPAELSGGQRQRVGVARALAADPPVLLMDEPFGAVDPIVRARLQDELLGLQSRVHKTIVLVTHDIDEAIRVGDRVAILGNGGVLEQYDRPAEILRAPANGFVEGFLGTDRGIKRLSLITVGEVPLETGPVVAPGAPAAEARRVMERYGVDWIGLVDGNRLLGWVWGREIGLKVEARPRPFRALLRCDDSLKQALDTVITTRTRVAPVVDGERFVGMLTAEMIGRQVTE